PFSLHSSSHLPPLHSFPTRRSSDLDDGALGVSKPHRLRELGRHRLERDADPAALHPPAVDELRGDALDHVGGDREADALATWSRDRKSTRLNSSHVSISYAVFCLKK